MPCPEKFRESLAVFGVDKEIIDEIDAGYSAVKTGSPKAQRAAYFKRAIDILNAHLTPAQVCDLLAWNACCKSGARDKASKEFRRINQGLPLAEKLAKIERAPYRNMGVPHLEGEDTLLLDAVSYVYEGKFACGCSNFRRLKRDYPVAKEYCFCCAGHFQYHYQIMLGAKLTHPEVVSSPLDSDGAHPCVFRFHIEQEDDKA